MAPKKQRKKERGREKKSYVMEHKINTLPSCPRVICHGFHIIYSKSKARTMEYFVIYFPMQTLCLNSQYPTIKNI